MKTSMLTIYRRRLPHWRMDGSVYFVTWRLNNWQSVLEPDERTDVVDAIKYFAEERYDLLAYVVMDNHVHVLIAPRKEFPLHRIIHTWKSFTARRLQENFGRVGSIWQKEYFDRIVRDEAELIEKAHYILGNPLKRWTDAEEYPWAGYNDVGSVPASLPGVGSDPKNTGTEAGATEEGTGIGTDPASLPGVGTLFLIFNHTITETQRADARYSLRVDRIVSLPPDLKELWRNIPPDAPEIHQLLDPLRRWLQSQAKQGDFVLIQGDFGACFLMVTAAREMGIIPVYSTTRRQASEEVQPDGSVTLVHRFEHVLFRKYGG